MNKIINLTLALTVISISGYANNGIDGIMNEIATNNLELKASEMNIQSDKMTIKATNNLSDPTAEMEYLFGNKGLGDKWGFGISQSFDWPGTYSARGNANKSRINALSYVGEMKRLEILLKAKQICIDIINVNKLIAAQKEIYDNVKSLYDQYTKGFNHGEISILDINKLKLELLSSNQKLDEYNSQKNVLIESLRGVNGNAEINAETLATLNTYPVSNLESLSYYTEKINKYDPEANFYINTTEANKKDVITSKMGWAPGFTVGYKYSNELGEKFNGFTVGISIPLFSNRNKVNATKAKYIADTYSQQNVIISKQTQANAQYSQLLSLSMQIDAYKVVLNDNQNINVLNKALSGGQITLLNYLMEVRYFLDAQNTLLGIEYSFNQILADLDRYNLLNK